MNLLHLWLACATPVDSGDTADSADTAETGDPVDCPDAMSNEEFAERYVDAYCAWLMPCATEDYTWEACIEQWSGVVATLGEPDRCRMEACLAELAQGTCETMWGEIHSCTAIYSDKDE